MLRVEPTMLTRGVALVIWTLPLYHVICGKGLPIAEQKNEADWPTGIVTTDGVRVGSPGERKTIHNQKPPLCHDSTHYQQDHTLHH